MNERDPQNERHEKTKKILKIAGGIVLAAGIILAVVGFVDIFSNFGSGDPPSRFWCLFLGFPAIAVGAVLLSFGFHRELGRYVKNESVPVLNEAADELRPAVRDIASAARDAGQSVVCPACGEENEKGSKFCKNCGKTLLSVCPVCGEEIEPGSKFCNHCGAKL